MRLLLLTVAALVASAQTVIAQNVTISYKKDYPNCAQSIYYGGRTPSSWERDELAELVTSTHGDPLPLEGVYEALIELDASKTTAGAVDLIYSGEPIAAKPYGEQDTWTREQLWPDSRGAVGSHAFADIHNNRPENTRVSMIKREMLFGSCGTVEFGDACEKPAFATGPSDTEQDGKVWLPPENVRGDIARALFYMELRYKKEDLGLEIVDCPPFVNGKMAYLSQLLEWHAADPVSDEELERNTNACANWQGNRNPFVDYPALVSKFWSPPQQIEAGTRTYPSCLNIPTPAPTAESTGCSELSPGDVFIYVVEADDPDGIGFLALEDIPGGLDLYMTDNPWTGEAFASIEGIVKLTVPSAGIKAGEQFGFGYEFGANQKWIRKEGNFNVGITGDSVFLYCLLGDSAVNPLVGYTNHNVWAPPGLTVEEYGAEKSALPDQLRDVGSVQLPHLDNYRYEGPDQGSKEELQEWMMDPNFWVGNDEGLGDQRDGANFGSLSILVALTTATIATGLAYFADTF